MRRAFTLIETLISLAIIGAVAATLGLYGISVSTARAKAMVTSDVQSNARFALDLIQREIRKATSANVPILVPDRLELDLDVFNIAATVIDLDAGGRLRITKGASSNYVTASDVRLTTLRFTDLTDPMSIRENIKIEMTVGYAGGDPYSYSIVSTQSVRR